MRKFLVILAAFIAIFCLTGCGESMEQRVANKAACEKAGGEYYETQNGFTYEYLNWGCLLDTEKN